MHKKTLRRLNFILAIVLFFFGSVIPVQAKKNKNPKPVRNIEIGQVYSDYEGNYYEDKYYGTYFRLLDNSNYVAVCSYGSPDSSFKDAELYDLEFYSGTYIKKGKNYYFNKKKADKVVIYFYDYTRHRKQQYSEISRQIDKSEFASYKIYFKKSRYYMTGGDFTYKLRKASDSIVGYPKTKFPNNSEEFLSNFQYVPIDDIHDKDHIDYNDDL